MNLVEIINAMKGNEQAAILSAIVVICLFIIIARWMTLRSHVRIKRNHEKERSVRALAKAAARRDRKTTKIKAIADAERSIAEYRYDAVKEQGWPPEHVVMKEAIDDDRRRDSFKSVIDSGRIINLEEEDR